LLTCRFPYGSSDYILVGMAVAVSSGFVGRAEELARLLAALKQAEQGRPAMVPVVGDAGVARPGLLGFALVSKGVVGAGGVEPPSSSLSDPTIISRFNSEALRTVRSSGESEVSGLRLMGRRSWSITI